MACDPSVFRCPWGDNNPALANALLDGLLPTSGSEDLRSFDWYHLWHLSHAELATLNVATPVVAVAAAPDGGDVAIATNAGEVRLYDKNGQFKQDLSGGPFILLAFSGTSELVGLADRGWTRIWDLGRPGEFKDDQSTDPESRATLALPTEGYCDDNGWLAHVSILKPMLALLAEGRAVVAHSKSLLLRFSVGGRHAIPNPGDQTTAIAISPGAERFASITGDGLIMITETDDASNWVEIGRQSGAIITAAFSPDGHQLATGAVNGEIALWNVDPRKLVRTFPSPEPTAAISSLVFSSDGMMLAAGTSDPFNYNSATPGRVVVWKVQSSGMRIFRGHSARVSSLAFVAKSHILMSGSDDGTARLWDADKDEVMTLEKPEPRRVFATAVSSDGHRVVTGSEGLGSGDPGDVDIWDVPSRRRERVLRGHTGPVEAVALTNKGTVASAGTDGTVRLWNADTGDSGGVLTTDPLFPIFTIAVDAAEKRLAAGGGNYSTGGVVQIWNLETRRPEPVNRRLSVPIRSLAFSPTGNYLMVGAGSENPTLARTLDLLSLSPNTGVEALMGFSIAIRSLAISPSGRTLAVGWNDRDKPGNIQLWSLDPIRDAGLLSGHIQMVNSLAFSPDGRALISGSGAGLTHHAGEIKVWDLELMQERATIARLSKPVYAITLSSDGRTLVAATGDHTVSIWQVSSASDVAKEKTVPN